MIVKKTEILLSESKVIYYILYNSFFYTQIAFDFNLQNDFYIVHDNTDIFLLLHYNFDFFLGPFFAFFPFFFSEKFGYLFRSCFHFDNIY